MHGRIITWVCLIILFTCVPLVSAQEWLIEYLDETDPIVEEIVAEIDDLIEVALDQPLPDVSGSLSALLAVRRGES